ncbi:MAG: aminoacyl--tRNA ligase-related protein [bacterium]
MRQSKLFTKTRREGPKDEVSKNASLLIRAGFVDKLQAGVYSYLPLGYTVIKKIENIIREEVNKVGAQEIFMPSLHPKELWQKTGRWDTMDDLYKIIDVGKRESALAPTHEEVVVPLVKNFVNSYKDLPLSVYQFQNKFRMELRAKSGILRGREFVMKDMYSFHRDENDMHNFYETMAEVYNNIFKRIGIGHLTFKTYASGGSFSKFSHEFQMVTSAGEDKIYVCDKCLIAINDEIISTQKVCPSCGGDNFKEEKSIEVGNIFELKTKFTEPFEMVYKNEEGKTLPILMGCYGIGLGRAMGAVVEALSDEAGIIWPESIAPFKIHLIEISSKKDGDIVKEKTERIYEEFKKRGVEIIYDDRDVSAGAKFSDADLIGIPYRIIVSQKTLDAGGFELKVRKNGEIKIVTEEELFKLI